MTRTIEEQAAHEIQGTNPRTGAPLEPGQSQPNLQTGTTFHAIAGNLSEDAEPPPDWPLPDTPPDELPPMVEGADYRAVPIAELPAGPMVVEPAPPGGEETPPDTEEPPIRRRRRRSEDDE